MGLAPISQRFVRRKALNGLKYALEHPAVKSATAIVRRKLDSSHPKLTEVVHQDFADCSALAEALSVQEGAVFCLGAYTGVVSDAELRTITVDYPIEFARVLHASSPGAAFSFLSGSGADPTGRSRMPFARDKGEAEKVLLAAGSRAFTSSGQRTSTLWSRARNRISATACCARSTQRFDHSSLTR